MKGCQLGNGSFRSRNKGRLGHDKDTQLHVLLLRREKLCSHINKWAVLVWGEAGRIGSTTLSKTVRRIGNDVSNMYTEARNLLDERRKINHGLGTLI